MSELAMNKLKAALVLLLLTGTFISTSSAEGFYSGYQTGVQRQQQIEMQQQQTEILRQQIEAQKLQNQQQQQQQTEMLRQQTEALKLQNQQRQQVQNCINACGQDGNCQARCIAAGNGQMNVQPEKN